MKLKWLCYTGLLLVNVYSTNLLAQFGQSAIGKALEGVATSIKRSNQSQVIWHQGYWWAAFRELNSSVWFLYKYENGVWIQGLSLGVSGTDAPDMNVDHIKDKLYVIFPAKSRFNRLTYSSGAWTLDAGFPKTVAFNVSEDFAASLTRANDGDLFVFYEKTSALRGIYSSDGGNTWTTPDFVIRDNFGTTLTDAIAFRSNNQDYTALFAAEGDAQKRFMFLRLGDGDDPLNPANWIEENIPINFIADNHINMIKDFAQNLYAIVKLGGTGDAGETFKIAKRSASSGNWSAVNVFGVTIGQNTRPALALDESKNKLYAFATIGDKIQYASVDKDNLSNIQAGDWHPALRNGNDEFNNVTVSYQPLGGGSNLMVAAENKTLSKIWYHQIDLEFSPADPIIISEVKSLPPAGKFDKPAKNAASGARFIEFYNFSRSPVSLGSYTVKYYNDNAAAPTGSKQLGGSIPPLGYLVLAPDTLEFQMAYGFTPDFTDPEFDLDGGPDGIILLKGNNPVDAFNNAGENMLSWEAGQHFQRANYPNDGYNLFVDYVHSGAAEAGSPGADNDIPLPKLPGLPIKTAPRAKEIPPQALTDGRAFPESFSVYPNPFNPETNIRFQIETPAEVQIRVFDITGQRVKTIFEGNVAPGNHHYRWDGQNENAEKIPSGIYFLNISAAKFRKTIKLVLAR